MEKGILREIIEQAELNEIGDTGKEKDEDEVNKIGNHCEKQIH
jgi:hypothetical protein